MAIIKSVKDQLREERTKNEILTNELGKYKEMTEFLGILNDVDIEDLMNEEVAPNGEE